MSKPRHYIDQKEQEHIYRIQTLAIERFGSIRGLARSCKMNRKIMDRLYANGIFSLTSFSALKLCIALHITPNQLYGFEELPKIKEKVVVEPKLLDLKTVSYREVHNRLNEMLFRRKTQNGKA